MSKHYHKKSLSVRDEHYLWLAWADWFTYSSFFQDHLEDEMELRGHDPDHIAAAIDQARDHGWTLDELAEETDSYEELTELLREIEYDRSVSGEEPSDPSVETHD